MGKSSSLLPVTMFKKRLKVVFIRNSVSVKAYDTKFFISFLERAFKMMKNGIYFIVIAFLFAELFKIDRIPIC